MTSDYLSGNVLRLRWKGKVETGIPEEDIPHVTDRFYRGRHGQKTKGTGLGLYICREIVAMHGGDMHIESKPGAGKRVILSLPHREVA